MAEAGAESEGAMLLAQVHLRRGELPQALALLEDTRASWGTKTPRVRGDAARPRREAPGTDFSC